LEKLILERVKEHKIKRAREKSGSSGFTTKTRSSKSVASNNGSIQIEADVDCGANGVTAIHFASDDQHCLLIIRADKSSPAPQKK